MIVQVLRRSVLCFNSDIQVFKKYSAYVPSHCISIPYQCIKTSVYKNKAFLSSFSNERYNSKKQEISSYRRIHPSIIRESCKNNVLFTGINLVKPYPITVNNIRHFSNSTSESVNSIVTYNNGFFKYISESLPVEFLMGTLKVMHSSVGLPWWATIILTTVAIRTFITLPLTVHQYQVMAKLENLKHEMNGVKKRLQTEAKMAIRNLGWSQSQAMNAYNQSASIRQEWREMIVRENCHPFKTVVIVILQIPIWVSFSIALRNLCYMLPKPDNIAHQSYLELTTGGFGWMMDLTQIDPLFILPVSFGVLNLAAIEIQQLLYTEEQTRFRRIYTNFIKGVTICLIPIVSFIPSSLILFWTTNSFYTLLQSLLLISPKFRRLGRIPVTDKEKEHPYVELLTRARTKYGIQKIVAKQ